MQNLNKKEKSGSKFLSFGIVEGWPGTYWIEKTKYFEMQLISLQPIKEKIDGKNVTISVEDQLGRLKQKYKQQCLMTNELHMKGIPIDGLLNFLSIVRGENRAKYWWIMKEIKRNKLIDFL